MRMNQTVAKHSGVATHLLQQLLFTLSIGLLLTAAADAAVPTIFSYQGRLTTPVGVPVADGTYSVTFRLYETPTGGISFWEESKLVATKAGLFSVQLGQIVPLTASVLTHPSLFLAIKIGVDAELLPRSPFNAVPFASTVGSLDGASAGLVHGRLRVESLGLAGAAVAGAGELWGGDFTARAPSGDAVGLTGTYQNPGGTFDGTGVLGIAVPADGWGIGGDFEGGYIGCRCQVPSDLAVSVESHIGLYSEVSGSGTVASNFGARCSGGGGHASFGVRAHAYTSNNVGGTAAYGIYSDVDGNAGGLVWAGYFNGWTTCNGTLEVLGTLYKPGGAFRIDHPLDPENKYLEHSFVESPDMKNIYDGIVTLDEHGEATVQMADWFEALNKDFRYQLTAIGAPAPGLYISKEVENNRFSIAGGKPGLKVSWTVTGIRHDPYANANRIQVEVPKPPEQRGLYVSPESYGLGLDKHIHHRTFEQIKKDDAEMAKRSAKDK